jgi:hypothetical protein
MQKKNVILKINTKHVLNSIYCINRFIYYQKLSISKMLQGKIKDYKTTDTLYEYFEKNIINNETNCYLDKNAIIYKNKILNYNQVNENVIKINNYIYNQIAEKNLKLLNKFIGIHLNPDEFTVSILLAINSLSLSYLPIDPLLPTESI